MLRNNENYRGYFMTIFGLLKYLWDKNKAVEPIKKTDSCGLKGVSCPRCNSFMSEEWFKINSPAFCCNCGQRFTDTSEF